jgi:hypothetical protein
LEHSTISNAVLPLSVLDPTARHVIDMHDKKVRGPIGEMMGALEEVNVAEDESERIRVHTDPWKPLERGRALVLDGKSHYVTFKYEKLYMFCINCWRIIHGDKGCTAKAEQRKNHGNGSKPWGVWLRVDSAWHKYVERVGGKYSREEAEGRWKQLEKRVQMDG